MPVLRGQPLNGVARRGAYPGSFNPPTVAHLAIAEAAVRQCHLDRLDLTLSVDALGKEPAGLAPVAVRADVLRSVAASRPWLGVVVTEAGLVADIAADYDAVVLGADKWAQVVDPDWYRSAAARDEALWSLPHVAFAPRAGVDVARPTADDVPAGVTVLDVDPEHHGVSASGARDGARPDWMLPEAAAHPAAARWWSTGGRQRPT